ncbi:MAG: hypothetical protein AAFO07_03850 [Bacteroidota bacterium]
MAKLFRKIRQKLIVEKKLQNYLLYALGEILLVVIGILLALQINSMSQDRQKAKLEKVLLAQAKFEILETYKDVWRDMGILEMGDRSHHEILQHFADDKPYADSLCFDFYWITMDEYVYPPNASFGRLKEEGLDIIKDDTIRLLLQSLYEGRFPRLTKNVSVIPDISDAFNDYYLNFFKPNTDLSLQYNYPLADDTVGSKIYDDVSYRFPRTDDKDVPISTIGFVPLDFETLKRDPKFLMLLEQTKGYRDNKMLHYSVVKIIIKEVIKRIDRELEDD